MEGFRRASHKYIWYLCMCAILYMHGFYSTGIIDWSPIIEQILEKGRVAIKQTQDDKFTTLTSLLIYGLLFD